MGKTLDRLASRTVETPIGPMTLQASDSALVSARFGASSACDQSAILDQAERELREYFDGKRRAFNVPLAPRGTPFQLRVWEELQRIPYGQTRTYRDIARAAGNERACRAVGRANNQNPLPVFVPCHRVIGVNGSLTGYAGGLDAKQRLLRLEAAL